jgi:hypothetical protein
MDCDVIARYRCAQAALTTQDAAEAALAEGIPIDFSLLRRRFPELQPTGAALTGLLAGPGVTLTQLLWYYGEGLQGEQVLGNMASRIAAGERLDLSFGKVLERMLTMKKHIALGIAQGEAASMIKIVLEKLDGIAAQQLNELKVDLPQPVLVLGDASASMEICLETSAIVACMLAAIAQADVVTFSGDSQRLPTPSGVHEALELASSLRTRGSTCPAISMQEAYTSGKCYRSVLVITDEEENQETLVVVEGETRHMRFAEVVERYRQDISPNVELTFVSFLSNMNRPGNMTSELESRGIKARTFRLHRQPDLRRLDVIFASMSTSSNSYAAEVESRRLEAEARRWAAAV